MNATILMLLSFLCIPRGTQREAQSVPSGGSGEHGALHEWGGASGTMSLGASLHSTATSWCGFFPAHHTRIWSAPLQQIPLCSFVQQTCVQPQPWARQHLPTRSLPVSSPPLNQSPCSHSRSILITAPIRALLSLWGEVLTPSDSTIPGTHYSRTPVQTHNPPPQQPTLRDLKLLVLNHTSCLYFNE